MKGFSATIQRAFACLLLVGLVSTNGLAAQDTYTARAELSKSASVQTDKSDAARSQSGLQGLPDPGKRISLQMKEVTAKAALEYIAAKGGLSLAYQESVFEDREAATLNLDLTDVTVFDALYAVMQKANLTLQVTPAGHLIVRPITSGLIQDALQEVTPSTSPESAPKIQTGSISGRVTDAATGEGIPGANVSIAGTSMGAATGMDGQYTISELEPGTYTIRASFIGFLVQEVSDVPVAADEVTELNFALEEDVAGLEEVIVVGYGTQRRQNVTGAISSVDGEALATQPVLDVASALQGRAPGVDVVRNGGAPGGGASIRIRGTGTVNNADPLVVIDGVPSSSGMDAVDPDNIASLEVLKDASAAAIYGNRAANGVILISTKRGRPGDGVDVSFKSTIGVSSPIKTLDVLDAPTLAQLKRERYSNDGLPVNPIWEDAEYQTQRTDWQNELLGSGMIQDYDLSVSGGNETSTFFLSGSFADEDGMMESSYFQRYGLVINSDHRIGSRLNIRQNLRLARTKSSSLNTLSAQNGVLWSAIRFHPGLPVQWPDGEYSSSQISGEFGDINNPIYTVDTHDANTASNRILGNVEGTLNLIGDLSVKANVGLDYRGGIGYTFQPIIDKQIRAVERNSLQRSYSEFYSILSEVSLNYNAELAQHHSVDAFAAWSLQTFDEDIFSAQRLDFADESPEQRVLSSGNTVSDAVGSRSDDALMSYISRVNYAFRDKYLLTASLRADASSRFAEENRWGIFPAVSAGWRISQEPFFAGIGFFDDFKLTAGWGQSGNESVARLQYLGLFGPGPRYSFGGNAVTGVSLLRLPNVDIAWETAEMTNVGLDMSFFNYRMRTQIEYFLKNTKEMLLAPPTVGTIGTAGVPDENVGRLRNQGLEISADYNGEIGSVNFNVYGNAAFIRNKVVSINEEFLGSVRYGRPNQELARTYEGHPIATFYGWRTDGLYQNQSEINDDPGLANDPRREDIMPGDVRFLDLNDDGLIDAEDRTILGSPHPDASFGFGTRVDYRSLDLQLFFVGTVGAEIYNADRMQGLDPTYPFNMYQEAEERWNGEGTSNTVPRMTTSRTNLNHRTSDLFMESGDFVRLKSITIGYTLPQSVFGRSGLSNIRLYLTGQNVFTVTSYSGMDPELGYSDGNLQRNVDFAQYPQARMWTFGVNVDI